ncbi:hypothetical protein RB601_000041 [Gaeumannomyces tritici]
MSSQHHHHHHHQKRPPPLRPLLLAGGRSTRMGSPKHLLPMPDGRPLYQHLAEALQAACPECPAVHVSLAYDSPLDARLRFALISSLVEDDDGDDSTSSSEDGEGNNRDGGGGGGGGGLLLARLDDYARAPSPSGAGPTLQVLLDGDGGGGWDVGGDGGELSPTVERRQAGGPAAGLLAAHEAAPDATWLVVACDFPLVTADVLGRLRREHCGGGSGDDGGGGGSGTAPAAVVTCFRGADGRPEPLVGIWTPEALGRLAAAAASAGAGGSGSTGGCCPDAVLEELGDAVVTLEPPSGGGICDVKTKEDWDCALEKLRLRREPRPSRRCAA